MAVAAMAPGAMSQSAGALTASQRTVAVDRGAYDPSISPDGTTIAVGILGKIWLLPIKGGAARQLTFGHGWDHHPVWSPNGDYLAYVHESSASSEIMLHSFASGGARELYRPDPEGTEGGRPRGTVLFGEMAFHPTNGRLYFIDFRFGIWSVDPTRPRRAQIELLLRGSAQGGRARPGLPGITERSAFAFSPDGTSMVVERDTTGLWSDLHIAPFGTAAFTQLTASEKAERTDVSWSPAGDTIVYLEQTEGREALVIRSATGAGSPRRIDLGPYNGRAFALHPDGVRAIVVSARQLFGVDLMTGAVEPVPFEATFTLPSRAPGDLVVTNARLFDATGEDTVEQATVEVRDGTIVSVTTGPYTGGTPARVVDAQGRFLMPGLTDAHVHLWEGGKLSQALVPLSGVTSVLDLGSDLPETLNLRDAIRLGMLQGPHVYSTGPAIDGPEGRARYVVLANIAEPTIARAVVGEFARNGVDALKLYAFLEPDVVAAAIEEAHALGLPVVGDMVVTSWADALEAGLDGFVHLMDHKWRFLSDEQPADDPRWGVVEPDSARMNAFFADVAARSGMFDPTMMGSSQHYRAEDFAAALGAWTEAVAGEGVDEDADDYASIRRAGILADILQTMQRHGVRWVAGTDIGASRLLDELEIYETIGIPNATILQTATANVARWLKRDDFGTVEPGRRADLILVDGDPLQRIRDLENIVLVVQSGRVILEK